MERQRFEVFNRNGPEVMPMTDGLARYCNLAEEVFQIAEFLERATNAYDASECRTRVMRLAPEIISLTSDVSNQGLDYSPLLGHLLSEWAKVYKESPIRSRKLDDEERMAAGMEPLRARRFF